MPERGAEMASLGVKAVGVVFILGESKGGRGELVDVHMTLWFLSSTAQI